LEFTLYPWDCFFHTIAKLNAVNAFQVGLNSGTALKEDTHFAAT
jgi:hypothetical protein